MGSHSSDTPGPDRWPLATARRDSPRSQEVRSATRFCHWQGPDTVERPVLARPRRPRGPAALASSRDGPRAGTPADGGPAATSAGGRRGRRPEGGSETRARPARSAHGAHRPLPGPAPEPGAHGLDLPARDHPGPAMARQEREAQGGGARQGREVPELGPERSGDRDDPGPPEAPRRGHHLDHQPRERLPGPAGGRDGRRAAAAQEGEGRRQARVERQDEGRDEGRRDGAGRGDRARRARRSCTSPPTIRR